MLRGVLGAVLGLRDIENDAVIENKSLRRVSQGMCARAMAGSREGEGGGRGRGGEWEGEEMARGGVDQSTAVAADTPIAVGT